MTPNSTSIAGTQPRWSAVFSLCLGVIGFVSAELLPVSLLTPIAADLGVSEGMAGQTVTVTAIVALIASLFVASVIRGLDRRLVLLGFTVLLVASNLLAAFSTSYAMLVSARVLLGLGLGGFWSMAAATSMRLVPEAQVPRALAIIFGGVSVATVVAAPVGAFLGDIIGWRGVFMATAAISAVALIWQALVLPSMTPTSQSSIATLFKLFRRPRVGLGMLACLMVFGGHFAFFTYLRPFLETVTLLDVNTISIILFGFGLATVLGTTVSGSLISRSLYGTLGVVPLALGLMAVAMVLFGQHVLAAGAIVTAWGFANGTVPVAWTTWVTRTVPDEAESAGGLQVAAIQLAITAGAGLGGLLFDTSGPYGSLMGSAVILIAAAALISVFLGARTAQPAPA